MTLKEFEERTGKPISAETYDAIEKTFSESDVQKANPG